MGKASKLMTPELEEDGAREVFDEMMFQEKRDMHEGGASPDHGHRHGEVAVRGHPDHGHPGCHICQPPFASGGEMQEIVALYSELRQTSPFLGYSRHTFLALLVSCANLMDEELARQLHAHLALLGLLSHINIASSLVDVYSKCSCIDDVHKLFDEMPVKDVNTWTTIVCSYAKVGQLTAARLLFDQMPGRNILTCNALMDGYVLYGQAVEALSIFQHLIKDGVHPNQFTFNSALSACTAIGSLKHGEQIHGRLLRVGFDQNETTLGSLIGMYSKCGYLAGARQVFNLAGPERRDTLLWIEMLSALCHHGHGHM